MIVSKQFYIEWFLPGMKPLDYWSLNLMNGRQDVVFRCSQNHALWKPFDIHNGYYNWCSVAMTREECEIVCRWLLWKRQGLLMQTDFIRAVNSLSLNEEHKLIIFLKIIEWDNISIGDAVYTSPENVRKVLSRAAAEAGYCGTPAFINDLKMRLYHRYF